MSDTSKKRVTIWMRPEQIQRVEALFPSDNSESRSEFIGKAVDFYCGYLQTNQSVGYLHDTLISTVQGGLGVVEGRVCRLLFKLAVELSMAMNVVAATNHIDPDSMKSLRERCVKDVKKSIGSVQFDSIYAWQNRLDLGDESDA